MYRNYINIAVRNIKQQPLYALINIFSLAIGLASCVAIYLFIEDERSFDAFHSKYRSIYRLCETQNFNGTTPQKVALTGGPMGPVFLEEFPEVVTYTRFWGGGQRALKLDDKQFLVNTVASVDSTFLDIFDFELLYGDRKTVLDEPNTMVLTEKTALKFFSNPDEALGKTITKRDREYKITGILKDVPENSHLQFDVLESIDTYTREDSTFNTNWGGNFLVTYLILQPPTRIEKMEAKFPEWLVRWTGQKDITDQYTFWLQPLSQVHLGSTDVEHDYQNYRKFNGTYLRVFTIIGIFILLIAAVNFMNLTTARASHRWKEIGVRKSIGARKTQLFGQFIFESTLLAFMALIIAILLNLLFIPILNQLIGRHLAISNIFFHPLQFILLLGITGLLGILTGIYPSFYMTSFSMAHVLKGGAKIAGKSVFRSSLVILQFGLALAMIVSTLIVVQQLSFMKNTDLGFNKDQIMLVGINNKEVSQKFEVLKTELLRSHYIKGVTASGQRIGNNFHQWGFKVKTDTGVMNFVPSNVNVDYDYLKVYGIQLIDGRDFSKDFTTDKEKAFIINESMAKELKLKNPVGTVAGHGWYHNDSLGTIIGVVKDFNFNSLHHKINTLSLACHPDWGYDEMSIKIDGDHIPEVLAELQQVWKSNINTFPLSYSFLDEHFDNLYRSDAQMSAVVTIMAILAILISCMGLFGLAAIITERKIKEIGIRKTLGATEIQIVTLLSQNFAKLILISFILASPITYYLLSEWLHQFAYRIDINPMLFLLGGLVAMTIALATIGYHTMRSARNNPVKALRTE